MSCGNKIKIVSSNITVEKFHMPIVRTNCSCVRLYAMHESQVNEYISDIDGV